VQAREYENVAEPAVTMYSYGQPRVGNLPFSSDYGGCLSIRTFSYAMLLLPAPKCSMPQKCLRAPGNLKKRSNILPLIAEVHHFHSAAG
jgi:hypothetical protein